MVRILQTFEKQSFLFSHADFSQIVQGPNTGGEPDGNSAARFRGGDIVVRVAEMESFVDFKTILGRSFERDRHEHRSLFVIAAKAASYRVGEILLDALLRHFRPSDGLQVPGHERYDTIVAFG